MSLWKVKRDEEVRYDNGEAGRQAEKRTAEGKWIGDKIAD